MRAMANLTPKPPHARRGMSVVEVLVALMLLSVGLLAIAGSTTLALRSTIDASRTREATQRVSSRIARLAAAGCLHARSGSVVNPGSALDEHWSVAAPAAGFSLVTDSVSWMSARGSRSFVVTSAIPC